jgi:hypothetical protein
MASFGLRMKGSQPRPQIKINPKEQERQRTILQRNLEMYWHRCNGMTLRELSTLYGISQSHAGIVTKNIWRYYVSRFDDERAIRFPRIKEAKEIYDKLGSFQ